MSATTPADLRPDVDDVALLLRTRTVGGQAQGGLGSDTGPQDLTTFDETTRPKASEVDRIIDTCMGVVTGLLGVPFAQVPEQQYGAFTFAVEVQAAILIEVSFFRESTNQDLLTLWSGWLNDAVAGIKEEVSGSPVHLTMGSLIISTLAPPGDDDAYAHGDVMPGIDTPGTLSTPLIDERPSQGNVPGMS